MIPESHRYYTGVTFNLTPSQIKEKFPSNAFEYYTTYNGYPNKQNTIGNVEWDGSSYVSSITALFSFGNAWRFETEADECRYYFWDSEANAYTKVWLGPKLAFAIWNYNYYSTVYDAYSDAERTTEFDMSRENWGNVNKIFLESNGEIAVDHGRGVGYQNKTFEELKADTDTEYYYYDDDWNKIIWDRETWVPTLTFDHPDYWY